MHWTDTEHNKGKPNLPKTNHNQCFFIIMFCLKYEFEMYINLKQWNN